MTIKQVIIMRTDLGTTMGTMAAQVAHASMIFVHSPETFQNKMSQYNSQVKDKTRQIYITGPSGILQTWLNKDYCIVNTKTCEWISSGKTKVILGVPSLGELRTILAKTRNTFSIEGDPFSRLNAYEMYDSWVDPTITKPTLVGCIIGPEDSDILDALVGKLKLL